MTQVSRIPISKKLEEQMLSLFRKSLADLRTENDVADFLDDLLTPTEKIMLGKRLAIALLLEKGYDQRAIHTVLKVSTSTVSSVNYWLKEKGSGYRKVISAIRKAEKWKEFSEQLDVTLKEMFSVKAFHRRAYSSGYKTVQSKTIL